MMRTFAGAVVAAALTATAAQADSYTPWKYNAPEKRYECEYTYDTKAGKPAAQAVYAYDMTDKDRYGWAYFYNAKGEPWGRCAAPGNPKYDAKAMYWQKLNDKGDGYTEYPEAGYCPAPADGKKPIPQFPAPPK